MSEMCGTASLSDDAVLTVLVHSFSIGWKSDYTALWLVLTEERLSIVLYCDWVPDHQNGRHISMKVYCKSCTEWMFDVITVHLSAKRCEHASAVYLKWFGWPLMLDWSIIKGCTEHWWFVFVDLRYQTIILKRVVGKLKFTLDFFTSFYVSISNERDEGLSLYVTELNTPLSIPLIRSVRTKTKEPTVMMP